MFPAILIGAVLGFAFGRLPGMLMGAAFGWWIGRQVGRISPTKLIAGAAQHQFLETTFAVAGAISKSDGRVDKSEIAALEAMMQRFRFTPEQRKQAIAAFNRGKQPDFDVDNEVRRFRATCRGQVHLIQVFLTAQIQVAIADGQITDNERELIFRVGRGLGLSEQDLARLDASLRLAQGGGAAGGRRPPQRDELADAYKIIGVSSSASDAEVKKAYRRLMAEHHPDRLAAKGLPESMRAVAEQKTSEITRAYDLIKQARAG